MSVVRAHIFVTGMVQGVGYRLSTLAKAKQLGVGGWVRNLPDGRVEAVFEGVQNLVEEMVNWCHNGPTDAVVRDLIIEYEEPEGLQEFEIRR
ncbi:MAG: acylphosphatase [Chroococcidiopsidaceae cyanobacterium CP_BM_ER_R8_30]|nr:acylphosphatase [Chroococcidiopsidaceae cyanobacterium CP_BM_ER_R8_30]